MSHAERYAVTVTTDSSGDAVAYTERPITGEIVNVSYTKDDFADTVDFTIVLEGSGLGLWGEENVTASKTVAPMQSAHSQAGAALLYADSGEPVTRPIYAAAERVKFTVANGGDTKSGTFTVVVA